MFLFLLLLFPTSFQNAWLCGYKSYNVVNLFRQNHPEVITIFMAWISTIPVMLVAYDRSVGSWWFTMVHDFANYGAYIHTHIYLYIQFYIHMYIYTYLHLYADTFILLYKDTFLRIYIHTYIYIYIHTYIHTNIHLFIYIYLHI